jgi:predicted nucleic acid-binding protein
MNSFVLDCSVALAWLHEDGDPAYVEGTFRLLEGGATAFAPPIWYYEMVNGLVMAQRRKRASAARISEFLEALNEYAVQIFMPDWKNVTAALGHDAKAASGNNLTAYDNAYLLTALQLGLPLASLDCDLIRAARKAGIEDAVKNWS